MLKRKVFVSLVSIFSAVYLGAAQEAESIGKIIPLPSMEEQWSFTGAEHCTTPFREKICLNGLWQVLPVSAQNIQTVPTKEQFSLYFKVPGIWPSKAQYPSDGQVFFHKDGKPELQFTENSPDYVWYRRELTIPANWNDRKIELDFSWIQIAGQVFLDGKYVGAVNFPGGKVLLNPLAAAGRKQELLILVSASAKDLYEVSFNAPDRATKTKADISCRGINGDIYLTGEPLGAKIGDMRIDTSVSSNEITFDVSLKDADPGVYYITINLLSPENEKICFEPHRFSFVPGKRLSFKEHLKTAVLWDIDAFENIYHVEAVLKSEAGELIDAAYPESFGFRDFKVSGRDFYLNGKKIHLRSFALYPNMHSGFYTDEYFRSESAARKAFGQNHVITTDYAVLPGRNSFPDAFYRGFSRNGILLSCTLPHPKDFDWSLDDPLQRQKYENLVTYLIRRYQNLPGIVLYASTHNATGYAGDQNPLRIDGIHAPDSDMEKSDPVTFKHRQQALLAEKIVSEMDPSRPVYHHECGNLGSMYTINTYLNRVPIQERSDWFEHWEKQGTKPLFIVEWGMPHIASWSSYRGPNFIWTNEARQCVWLDEFNAEINGEQAYAYSENKKRLAELQSTLCTGNKPVYFNKLNIFGYSDEILLTRKAFVSRNFRDIRARGVSAFLSWDQTTWRWYSGKKYPNESRFTDLKKSGIASDFIVKAEMASKLSILGEEVKACFAPQLAWIAGAPGDITESSRYFLQGEKFSKTLIFLNDTRHDLSASYMVSFADFAPIKGSVKIAAGGRFDVPLDFAVPKDFPNKKMEIKAEVVWENGQKDSCAFEISVAKVNKFQLKSELFLFDPLGKSEPLLVSANVPYRKIRDMRALEGKKSGILVIGREALSKLNYDLYYAQNIRFFVLEQDSTTLEKIGFRPNEHGLRNLFAIDSAFKDAPLSDWRGSSTLLAPYLENLPELETGYPEWQWCGFSNKHSWRAGNRGCVAQVLPERPHIGNWKPLVVGGFDLQFAPLLAYQENGRIILFSQLDLSSRTVVSPEASELFRRSLLWLDQETVTPMRRTLYAGGPQAELVLKELKINYQKYDGQLTPDDLLILGPSAEIPSLSEWIERGLDVLALGLSESEIQRMFPNFTAPVHDAKSYSDYTVNLGKEMIFSGIDNSLVHWRNSIDAAFFPPDSSGGKVLSVQRKGKGKLVLCQLVPWSFDENEYQFRTTRRRTYELISHLCSNLKAANNSSFLKEMSSALQRKQLTLDISGDWRGVFDLEQKGIKDEWFKRPEAVPLSPVSVPGYFQDASLELADKHGWFWYFKYIDLESLPDGKSTLNIGRIDDESYVWLNGQFLGEITKETHPKTCWLEFRSFTLPEGTLKQKQNLLVVLCNDMQGKGGILGKPCLRLAPPNIYVGTPLWDDDPYRYYRW